MDLIDGERALLKVKLCLFFAQGQQAHHQISHELVADDCTEEVLEIRDLNQACALILDRSQEDADNFDDPVRLVLDEILSLFW